MTDESVRPRHGTWFRAAGGQVPLEFHPDPADPTLFVGVRADTKGPIAATFGDTLEADTVGPGQWIRYRMVHPEDC